jgi:8-oxo-dGTP pyrophosphatase MutT (NUDIX family)
MRETLGLGQDLERVINAYGPDGDERSYGAALELLEKGRPMWPRYEFDPGHFTASGFVASPDSSTLLLVLHGKLNRWLQPGGHFEPEDDSVESAAKREVSEETGVGDLARLGASLVRIDAHLIPERAPERAHIHFDLGVGFQAASTTIGPIDEVLDARWVRFEDLSDYEVDEAVLAGAKTLRSML